MSFSLSEEQQEFQATLRRFFAAAAPSAEIRRLMETDRGHDPAVWRTLTEELGLPGVAIPEACGGQGFSLEALCLAAEETGRALAPSPFFGSAILAGCVVAQAAPAEGHALLSAIAGGEVVALALAERDFDLDGLALQVVERSGDEASLTGTKRFVVDGSSAQRLVVVAPVAGGIDLFEVQASAAGVERRTLQTLDRTRKLADVHFRGAPARRLARDARPGVERGLAEANLALCAESVGGFGRVIESAIAYARERRQFGRAIGSFQAVKHKLADLWILFEGARTATREAVLAQVADLADAAVLVHAARAYVADAYVQAAFDNIQVHGGVGFTWEMDAHLYLRRAQGAARLLGDAGYHREQVARWLGARAA